MITFFLVIGEERRAVTAPFLPRVGDSVSIDGVDHLIEKVRWFLADNEFDDIPMVITTCDIAITLTLDSLALKVANKHRLASNPPSTKIAAIKELRELLSQHNMHPGGLKEAKEAIDRWWS